ncbi:MAG: 3-ketoacyl-ACP reductase [candidate division Zixibacteria bacterium SM23_73_2]|nr:MAG: 3-ketoacyl-ACP reductase [candidate division Zixibacteria bacterium SM23_73_2]
MKLKDRVAIVTGGASGIGKAISERFAREGAGVVICDVDLKSAQEISDRLKEKDVNSKAFEVDVSDSSQVERVVNNIVEEFKRIDILVNNAGISKDSLLIRTDPSDWDRIIAVNLKGAFNFIKSTARVMMRQKYGRILNITSVVGIMGNAGQSSYAASKAGLVGLTKSTAKELASRGITVNAVAPGYIRTPMTENLSQAVKEGYLSSIPLGKTGTPQQVANLVLFLASEEADYITGQVIQIDGGLLM